MLSTIMTNLWFHFFVVITTAAGASFRVNIIQQRLRAPWLLFRGEWFCVSEQNRHHHVCIWHNLISLVEGPLGIRAGVV